MKDYMSGLDKLGPKMGEFGIAIQLQQIVVMISITPEKPMPMRLQLVLVPLVIFGLALIMVLSGGA